MPPSLTIDAARLHDKIIATAFHRIVGSESGSLAQRERALRQARLPVNLGGMGLTSMESISATRRGLAHTCRALESCGGRGGRYASSARPTRRLTSRRCRRTTSHSFPSSRSCRMHCLPPYSARVRGGHVRRVRPTSLRLLQGGPGTLPLAPSQPARAQHPPPAREIRIKQ